MAEILSPKWKKLRTLQKKSVNISPTRPCEFGCGFCCEFCDGFFTIIWTFQDRLQRTWEIRTKIRSGIRTEIRTSKNFMCTGESPRNFPSRPHENDTCAVTPCTAIQGQNKCHFSEGPLRAPLWAIEFLFFCAKGTRRKMTPRKWHLDSLEFPKCMPTGP